MIRFIFYTNYLILGQPRLVGVGGKGVGKSTMLRYIANRLIQLHGQILWIDLDPGQAEFTLPGKKFMKLCKISTPN